MSTVLTALLVIALAKRKELNMDYRAAAAAAIIGMGATWALGISSSAAQLQANKASLPESILQSNRCDSLHRNHFLASVDDHDGCVDYCLDCYCILVCTQRAGH